MDNPVVLVPGEWTEVKLWHTVYGLFLWEFFTTLDYEWKVFRGHIPYVWTIWIYSITRVAGLMAAILCFVGMDVTTPINCQAWISLLLIFSYLSLASASLLIVLRIIAIWNKNKIAVALAIGTWGINVAFLIEGPVRMRSVWVLARLSCGVVNAGGNKFTLVSMATTDVILLSIMLVGLLRLRSHGGGTFGLAQLLWKQGVIWILLATVTEIPPAIFLTLNLNDRLNIMFQAPAVVTMTIAATRMHRSLVDFTIGYSDAVHDNAFTSGFEFGTNKRPRVAPIPLSPMEISVRTVFEHHLTLQVGDHDPSINTDEGMHEKPKASSLDEDIERGV